MISMRIVFLSCFLYLALKSEAHIHYGVKTDIDNAIDGGEKDAKKEEVVKILHTHNTPGASATQNSKTDEDDEHLRLMLNAFGKNVTVDLRRVHSAIAGTNTPVWLAQSFDGTGDVKFSRAGPDALGKAIKLYQDRRTSSSIALFVGPCGRINFIGMLYGLLIRYLPPSPKTKRTADEPETIDGYSVSGDHVVSLVSRKRRHATHAVAADLKSQIEKNGAASNVTVYPDILVATDYNVSINSTTSVQFYDHLIYVYAFFNGIDLLFQQLSNPKVKLHIAGIVVGADHGAAPYINKNRDANGRIDATKALQKIGPFYERLHGNGLSAGSYDMIVALTSNYICDQHEGEICTPLLAGVSSLEAVCKDNYPVVRMAAIVEDNLAFSGIRMTAHELGHLMGAEHDGEKEEGTQDCDAKDGYIMSKYNESSPVSLKWSKCSIEALKRELRKDTAKCLHNAPDLEKDGYPLPYVLPGHIKGHSSQCLALGYRHACQIINNCQVLKCTNDDFLTSSDCKPMGVPPAQGSLCGLGRRCINGECIQIRT